MITHLLETAAQTFEVPCAASIGQSRQRHIVQARQAVAWALRQIHPELSLASIGDLLGGRDHTTIIWAFVGGIYRSLCSEWLSIRADRINGAVHWRHLAVLCCAWYDG